MRSAALVGSHATRYKVPAEQAVKPATERTCDDRHPSPAAPRRARHRRLCARQEQRAGRRQGVQAVVERDAARARARRRSRPTTAVGEHLEDYPDGSASALREAIGRAFGLDPDRIVCGAGSDDLLNLLARAYLADGDEAIHTTHGFLVYPIATLGTGATPVVAPEKDYTADVDAILERVTPKTKMVFLANPNNPTGTYLPFDEVKRLHRACRRMCCSCSTRPMPNMSAATTTRPASSWSRPARTS